MKIFISGTKKAEQLSTFPGRISCLDVDMLQDVELIPHGDRILITIWDREKNKYNDVIALNKKELIVACGLLKLEQT